MITSLRMDLLFKLCYELSTDQGSREAAGEVPGTGTLGTPGPRPSPSRCWMALTLPLMVSPCSVRKNSLQWR